jgi:hypothetical protein
VSAESATPFVGSNGCGGGAGSPRARVPASRASAATPCSGWAWLCEPGEAFSITIRALLRFACPIRGPSCRLSPSRHMVRGWRSGKEAQIHSRSNPSRGHDGGGPTRGKGEQTMVRVGARNSPARRRAKRLLVRSAARPRRTYIWTELKRRAVARGFAPQDLERVHHYMSTHLKLEEPEYVTQLQKPDNHLPGLRAQPVYDSSEFAWTSRLVNDFETIRREVLEFSANLTLDAQSQGLTDRGRWSVLYFHKGGRRVEATTRACSRTSEIVDSAPGAGEAGQAYLSVLDSGTHIERHFGPTNIRLRCHLGVIVPDGARIRVGEEMCEWREGHCLVFDDSFEHEVWNDSGSERVVLIVDFWHPELTPAERWAITEARSIRFGLRDMLHA